MHYNELQSRSAEVEAMASITSRRWWVVADGFAKARFRAKPGPKKGSIYQKKEWAWKNKP
jgi:hypothetical protein